MQKKLAVEKDYMPCPESDGDELFANGIFVFNITRMVGHILKNPDVFLPEDVSVKDLHSLRSMNESYVNAADIHRPVILAEIAPSRYNLIDGHNRVEKAHRMGIQTLKAYRLNVHQHIRFLTSRQAYKSYLEYCEQQIINSYLPFSFLLSPFSFRFITMPLPPTPEQPRFQKILCF